MALRQRETNLVSLWRRANDRNVRLYYLYWQYTDIFIFQFVKAGREKWWPKFDLQQAFYILINLGKLYVRIDWGTSHQEREESCVETSDEDNNYDDDNLSRDNLSGVVATNRRFPWWQPRRWANLGNGFISSIILYIKSLFWILTLSTRVRKYEVQKQVPMYIF